MKNTEAVLPFPPFGGTTKKEKKEARQRRGVKGYKT